MSPQGHGLTAGKARQGRWLSLVILAGVTALLVLVVPARPL